MSNFDFLDNKIEFALFAQAAIEAERVYAYAPAMCAAGARKALELAVKWVYAADTSIQMPYKDNLQALIHEQTFVSAVNRTVWVRLPFVVKLGNLAVHTGRSIQKSDALASLKALFEFIEWIDYSYGSCYEPRKFREDLIPAERVVIDTKKIREQESLLEAKDSEIEALRKKIEEMAAEYTAAREQHQKEREFQAEEISEFETRKIFIDTDMKLAGWKFALRGNQDRSSGAGDPSDTGADASVFEEYRVADMAGKSGAVGYADYVLMGRDGRPLAVVEAKRSSRDPKSGLEQARLYADSLERKFGRRPFIFLTNGFETYFADDDGFPPRQVSGIFSRDDLQKLMNRRSQKCQDLKSLPINDAITDRYYQKEAIRAVCDKLEQGVRKHLLVMATGTGKTRTAASLTDVLSRGNYVSNALFLADRTALVKQAKDDFKDYLPDMSLCNLCDNKDDRNARVVFSTYPTILNAIDDTKTPDGSRSFSPGHFDLIIIDESHRSIFKKYREIFAYFDAVLVGLTATPKTEVDRNTYDFFEMEDGIPTYAYDYETAVSRDHVLVPYYNYEVATRFMEEGIHYDELSERDRERFEDDFAEDGEIPEFIPSQALNSFIFNEITVDTVIQDLMDRGIHISGGDRLGKTIIFAQNKRHAEFILERFNKLYPKYNGVFAKRVICDDSYSQKVIDEFKQEGRNPFIAISVDMMDTGIDVPECVNLVFFKKVRSKTKFWQMIGRGTRLCRDLRCVDRIDGEYEGKKRFLIFDYCGNFEYFRQHKEGFESREAKSLSESIFGKQAKLLSLLEAPAYSGEEFQKWREDLIRVCREMVADLNPDLISVKQRLRYVEKFKAEHAFEKITEGDLNELLQYIAPITHLNEEDEFAKRFDNFMYGLMLANMEHLPSFKRAKAALRETASLLEKKAAVPQIRARLSAIREIQTDEYWALNNVFRFEKTRTELRELIKFLDEKTSRAPVITRLADPVIRMNEGELLDAAYDFQDYRERVNRYICEHGDTLAIHKLTHNIRLTSGDFQELERIFTSELGSREDYQKVFGDTPFGLLVRKIARLDHKAAMQAFSEFINDASLNQRQIAFINKIIGHIEKNGYMESPADLQKPPFDKPVSFSRLFDAARRTAIVSAIREIKDNAVSVAA